MKKHKTVKTWLPLFSGFYNTIWDSNPRLSDYEYSEGLKDGEYEFDNSGYENELAEELCGHIATECPFIQKIKFEKVVSPKEYNFRNDSINVTISYDWKELANYLKSNKEKLDLYLNDRYTSYSGFMSHYDNTYDEWYAQTDGFKNLDIDSHRLGSLLQFYFDNEGITEESMYHMVETNVYEFCTPIVVEVTIENKVEVALQLLNENEIDEDFGYIGMLVKQAKEASLNGVVSWQEWLADSHPDDVLDHFGVEQLDAENESYYHSKQVNTEL